MKQALTLSLLTGMALTACVPTEEGSPARVMAISDVAVSQALGPATSALAEASAEDWAMGDPQLAALITRGLSASPHLAQVEARLRQATASMKQVRARRSPSVDANARTALGKISTAHGFRDDLIPDGFIPKGIHSNSQISIDLNWDTDLWGRNRAALAAALSEAEAARLDAVQARLMLARGLALAYLDYVQAHDDATMAAESAASYAEIARLLRLRFRAGLDNELAATRADATAAQARAEADEARSQKIFAQYRLAALVGEGPDFGLGLQVPAISLGELALDSLGIDAIARRADIAAARARVEGRFHSIKAAERDFYPNVSISALLGFQALDLGDLITKRAAIPTIGPAIHLPIFNGGRLKAKLEESRADRDGAIAAYNETLLNALRDAASALRRARDARAIHARYGDAHRAADRARQLADRQLSAQLVNKLAVLDARLTSQQAKRRERLAANQISVAQIELMAALGGLSLKPRL